ncbi:MAG: ABC transporter ATP-binding protein [Chloroflexota bacterium]
MQPLLDVQNITKTFQSGQSEIAAVESIHFSVIPGEFVCLLGPSGSGKSTLLRIVGGLLKAESGQVLLQGSPIAQPHPDIGFVFQKSNLMPWRTVLQNVLLPTQIRIGQPSEADESQAHKLLELVGLSGFADAYPSQLSGGMEQRAVLARTLMQKPKLLLMDEPFSALDSLTRERLNLELMHIQAAQQITIVMVTHSINEAVFLADRVLIMSDRPGHIFAEVIVDLTRPRTFEQMGSEQFGQIATSIRQDLNLAATYVKVKPNKY